MKVTNVSNGPRGIWANGPGGLVLVMIDAGESEDVDLAPGETAGEWFTFEGKASESAPANDILAALQLLDPSDDTHWTAAGLPAVDAVKAALGGEVNRGEIEAAAPGFVRPTD